MEKHLHHRAALTAVSLVAGVSAPAHASPVQQAYAEHTRLCISLFFSDHAAHAQQCLPSRDISILPPPKAPSGTPVPGANETTYLSTPTTSYPEVPSSYPGIGSSYPQLAQSDQDAAK